MNQGIPKHLAECNQQELKRVVHQSTEVSVCSNKALGDITFKWNHFKSVM